jgi:EpsI family protein
VLAPARAAVEVEREPFSLFPRQIGAWSGTTSVLEPDIEQVLGADDYLAAFYHHPAHAEGIDFFVAYYHSQTDGAGIHSPEACLPAGGWEIFSLERTILPMEATRFGAFPVNRAVIQRGLDQQLVYYWFEGRGRRVTNDFVAKFQTVADSARFGRSDGALVRVITPIGAGGVAAAEERLQGFLLETLDRLPRHVPE